MHKSSRMARGMVFLKLGGWIFFIVLSGVLRAQDADSFVDPSKRRALPAPEGARLWVEGHDEFVLHMQLHHLRLIPLARRLIDDNPDRYALGDWNVVVKLLLNHDASKINHSPNFLAKSGIVQRTQLLSEDLFSRLYHQDAAVLTPEERAMRQNIIRAINHVDRKSQRELLWEEGLRNPEQQNFYLEIEKIVDCVDRQNCAITPEEFGSVRPLRYFLKDPVLRAIAWRLARHYEALTEGLRYEDYKLEAVGRGEPTPNGVKPPTFLKYVRTCEDYAKAFAVSEPSLVGAK